MLFAESTNQDKQSFKYNGKELDQMHGLNQYDYAARYYDPAISRFTTIDPHAENYFSWSPYVYVGNNPMRLIDPDGKDWYRSEDGTAVMWQDRNDKSFTHTFGEGDNITSMEMKNIGSTYVQNLSDGSMATWNQNEMTSLSESSYFDQGNTSFIYSLANSNNLIVNFVYNSANDIGIIAQKLTFGYFDKTNEFTGGGAATNLDGTINYQETTSLLNTIGMFSGYMTNKGATTLGANIPKGIGHIEPKEGFWGASVINYGIGFVNGFISKGGAVKSLKGLGNSFSKQQEDNK